MWASLSVPTTSHDKLWLAPQHPNIPGSSKDDALIPLPRVCVQVNKEKHELRGKLLALQGRPAEAAQEIGFLGPKREQEMREMGQAAAAAAQGRAKGGGDGVAAVAAEPAAQGLVGKQGPAAPMVLQGLKKEL